MFLIGLLAIAILTVLNAAPLAYFVMLFLGNVGAHVGFWDLLPGAIAVLLIKNTIFNLNLNKGN